MHIIESVVYQYFNTALLLFEINQQLTRSVVARLCSLVKSNHNCNRVFMQHHLKLEVLPTQTSIFTDNEVGFQALAELINFYRKDVGSKGLRQQILAGRAQSSETPRLSHRITCSKDNQVALSRRPKERMTGQRRYRDTVGPEVY